MAALISQAGMALVVKLGGTFRPVTVKSTAMMCAVSVFSMAIISVYYEVLGKRGLGCFLLAALCFAVTVHDIMSPVNEIYYRYPALASTLAVNLIAAPVILGRHEREKEKHFEILSHENIFAVLALAAGLIISISLPVSSYNSWDDENHYERTLYASQSIYAIETDADIKLIYSPEIKAGSSEAKEYAGMLDELDENPEKVIAYNSARAFHPDRIGYIGSIIFTWLGRVLNLCFSKRYILGRIGNLTLYVAVMYFAIKKLDKGKTLLTCLALAPTPVFLSANYSVDPFVFAFSAVGFSYFFECLDKREKKLTWREIIIMVGAIVLAALPKLPYTLLLAFLLLMPKDKFESKKQMILYWALIIASALALFVLTYMSSFGSGQEVADVRGREEEISALKQIKYILSDPGAFIKLLTGFLSGYLNPLKATGAGLSNLSTSYEGTLSGLLLAVIIAAAFIDSPGSPIYVRVLGTVLCILMCAFLAWIFYLVYTPVGSSAISGCQARYLIPTAFVSASLVFGGWINSKHKSLKYLPVAGSAIILAINVMGIFK